MNFVNKLDTTIDYTLISLFLPITYLFQDEDDTEDEIKKRDVKTIKLVNLLITLFAMYLAWNCNKNIGSGERVLYTLIAGLFSGIYLVYYLARRIILKDKCGSNNSLFNNKTLFKKKNVLSDTSPLNTEQEQLFKMRR